MKLSKLLSAIGAGMLLAGTAHAGINGGDGELRSEGSALASCAVEDGTGATVTAVNPLNQGDDAYWFQYNSAGVSSARVEFIAVPLAAGNPMTLIYQRFEPTATPSTNIVTPFGVPFWASNLTSGNWLLITRNSAGDQNFCFFVVN